MPLRKFRKLFIDAVLSLLWKQWSTLGIAGQEDYVKNHILDPEALLLITMSFGRYDQRLFDEMISWLLINERFINVQRLRTILKNENFTGTQLLSAVAGFIQSTKNGQKWKTVAKNSFQGEAVNLFYVNTESSVPVLHEPDALFKAYGYLRNVFIDRELSGIFTPQKPASLMLQMRALWGLSCRAEVMLYFLSNGKGTASKIAEYSSFSWRSIQDVLFEIGKADIITHTGETKGRVYYLNSDKWLQILLTPQVDNLSWKNWPPMFRVLEIVLETLLNETLLNLDPEIQAVELRRVIESELHPLIIRAGAFEKFTSCDRLAGKQYVEEWCKSVLRLLEE